MTQKKLGWIMFIACMACTVLFLALSWSQFNIRAKRIALISFFPEKLHRFIGERAQARCHFTIVCFVSAECEHCRFLCKQLGSNYQRFSNSNWILITDVGEISSCQLAMNYGLNRFNALVLVPDSLGYWRGQYQLRQVPSVFIYDNHNRLAKSFTGATSIQTILKGLQ